MVITMSSDMSPDVSSSMSIQHTQQAAKVLQQKVNAACIAVNIITIFAVFIALFMGVMLGIFNATKPTGGMSENMHFLLGFSVISFTIAIPSVIFHVLVKRSIAQSGLWQQAIVWVYGILLLPFFPIGTAAAAVILYAQISWMRI
jgi:ABC-type methionine transport system permease subunit